MIITIDSSQIARGWAKDYTPSNSNGVEAAGSYSKSVAMSLYRLGRIGQLAPGETFSALTDASTRINALPLNGVVDSAGEAFSILANARVVQFGSGTDVVTAHNATAHGGHSNLTGEDILNYRTSTDEYVIYSFNDDTDADVGRRTKSTGGYVDNWLSTVPTQVHGSTLTKGVPHKMAMGPDGKIYITNGQYLAQFDITTNTIDYQAMNYGAGFVATGFDIFENKIAAVAYQATTYITSYARSESRCFFWDGVGTFYQSVFDLEDNYVSGIRATSQGLFAFTSGRNNTTKVKRFNGTGFTTIFESAQIGNPPRQGSIDTFQGMPHFVAANGAALNVIDGQAFHSRTLVTTDGQTSPADCGMVKNLASNELYVGRDKGSSTYDIVKIDQSGYYMNATFRDSIRSFPHPRQRAGAKVLYDTRQGTIRKIVIYLSQWGTGASLLLSLFKNYAPVSVGGANDLLNKTIAYADYPGASSISVKVTGALNVDTFLLNLIWNHASPSNTAAIIRKIDIYWDPTEKA